MNSKKNIAVMMAMLLMVSTAFVFFTAGTANASDPVVVPKGDPLNAQINTLSAAADGTVFVTTDGHDEMKGNITSYQANDLGDFCFHPEEGGTYDPDMAWMNGIQSAVPMVLYDTGSAIDTYTVADPAANPIYLIFTINPAKNPEHANFFNDKDHNYTASASSTDTIDPVNLPNIQMQLLPKPTVTVNGADLDITWTDMAGDAAVSNYVVYRSASKNTGYTVAGTAANGAQTFKDVGATGGIYHYYRIGVDYEAGVTDWRPSVNRAPLSQATQEPAGGDIIPPVANAGVDQTVNEDTLVTFDGSGSSDNIAVTSYTWTFTDGVLRTLTGVAPTYTFATPGVYTVTLDVADAAGNHDLTPDTMTVTVNDNTPIAITDNTPGSVAPLTAFDITCVGTDFQTLNINSITLFWEDVTGVVTGPVVASTYVSVGDNQITKADDNDNSPMDTHTWTWPIPAQATPGEVQYYFATNDGVTGATTYPVGADLVAGPYETVLIAVQGNQNQPHPLVGRIYDNATGLALNGAIVTATWYDSTDGAWFTNWTVSANDGLGVAGWYQIDIFHNNWTAGDLLYVNASYTVGGVPYMGYNTTLFQSGDDFLPDDDKEYINVYIDIIEYFELKWTLGWNIWSIPMIRAENVTLGLADLPFSWFANEHWLDTSQVGAGDEATLVAWTGAAYITYIYPIDNASANDITVTPDYGYWAEVGESWFTDEAALALPEVGILVPGQYIWRSMLVRTVTVNIGWNLLGWTSFATGFTGTDVIMTLDTCPVDADGINQPEIVANWTADTWEAGVVADMVHYEGDKGYTTFVSLGAYGQSTPNYDFPVGAGYGYWVYSYTAGTIVYATI